MKLSTFYKKILSGLVIATMSFSQSIHAANDGFLVIYATPDLKSSVVIKLPRNERITPFYFRDHWIKVGVNKTGVVGWVTESDLAKHQHKLYHIKNHIVEPNSYRIFEYSGSEPIDKAEVDKMVQMMHQQQQAIQDEMTKLQKKFLKEPFGPMLEPLWLMPGEEVHIKTFRNKNEKPDLDLQITTPNTNKKLVS